MLTSCRLQAKKSTFDKSSCIKLNIYQKLHNSNGNTFSFIPRVCSFSNLPWIAASEGWILTTLFFIKTRWEEIATRTSTSQPHSIRVLSLLPLLCKNHKKPEVDKIIQACGTLTLTKGFVLSLCRCSKQSVSCLITLNWSEHLISCGCFQLCSGSNNISLLLYACEVIHLINKGVTSPYVQE